MTDSSIDKTKPLIAIGALGLHVNKRCDGAYAFVGTVPESLKSAVYENEADAIRAAADWFVSQGDSFMAQHLRKLRDDLYEVVADIIFESQAEEILAELQTLHLNAAQ